HGSSGEIGKESRLQQSLKVDRAIVPVCPKSPDEFGDFPRAADAGAVAPLIGVNRNQTDVQPAELHHDLVFSLDQPIDFSVRKCRPELRNRWQAMHDIAQRTELHDEEAVEANFRQVVLLPNSRILLMTSRVEWFFGSPAMWTSPP